MGAGSQLERDMNSKPEETIFEAALGLPPDQRGAYLDKQCKGDAELRERVEGLLRAHDRAGEFLERPASPPPQKTIVVTPISEKPGDRIGPYKLLQELGE